MKNYLNPVWLLLLLFVNPVSAGVNCDGLPHTRLETTICSDPVLRTLDSELKAALDEARARGIIGSKEVSTQLNLIARQCRREPHEAINACLLNAEVKSLEWASGKLGQLGRHNADSRQSWRYTAGTSARVSHLQRQLLVAESRLASTGNPELTVVTLLGLIQVNKNQSTNEPLESRLASGCNHSGYGKKWRAVLQAHNHTCTDLGHPILFSSSEY